MEAVDLWHLLTEFLPGKLGLGCLIEMGTLYSSFERPDLLMFLKVFQTD